MAKPASRAPRRGGHRRPDNGWLYLAGGALAVIAVLAVIIIGAATRGGDGGRNATTVVPTVRPAAVPRDGLVYGNPDAPVTITEYLDFQ